MVPAEAATLSWHFLNIGTVKPQSQFTQQQIQKIASEYDYVFLAKFHDGFRVESQHETARLIKAENPAVKVFPYFSAKFRYPQYDRVGGDQFDTSWLLRDKAGNVLYRDRQVDDPETIPYVDLANPAYREWALRTLGLWLSAAPYAGIYFDSAEPIGDYPAGEVAIWEARIGAERVRAYNAGMRSLLSQANQLAGLRREVVYNGFAPSAIRGPGRNLDLLELTDGALNERFCLDVKGRPQSLMEDLDLMSKIRGKRLFMRASYPIGEATGKIEQDARFCLGVFLMGWRPGWSFYHFGEDFTHAQLESDLDGHGMPIGSPMARYSASGSVLTRTYSGGQVTVNTGSTSAIFKVKRNSYLYRRGEAPVPVKAGDRVNVPAQDALFFVNRLAG